MKKGYTTSKDERGRKVCTCHRCGWKHTYNESGDRVAVEIARRKGGTYICPTVEPVPACPDCLALPPMVMPTLKAPPEIVVRNAAGEEVRLGYMVNASIEQETDMHDFRDVRRPHETFHMNGRTVTTTKVEFRLYDGLAVDAEKVRAWLAESMYSGGKL